MSQSKELKNNLRLPLEISKPIPYIHDKGVNGGLPVFKIRRRKRQMKIIDRKALVAALIMACGNVACASDDLFGEADAPVGGCGADAPVGGCGAARGVVGPRGAGVDPRRQAASLVANLLAMGMGEEPQPKDTLMIEHLRKAFGGLTPQELKGIRFHSTEGGNDGLRLRLELVEGLTPLNIDRLQAIADHAGALFTRDMIPGERAGIIEVLMPLSVDEINTISIHVSPLFTYGMNGYDRARIITAFAGVDADQIHLRANAIDRNAGALFTRAMTPGERAEIIAVLAPLSVDQINAISIHAEELFYMTPPYSSRGIIRAFASLHAAQISSRMAAIRDYTERFGIFHPVSAMYSILASLDAGHIKAIERIAEMLFIKRDPTTIALWSGAEMIKTLASFGIDQINAIERNAKMLFKYDIVTTGRVYIGINPVERKNMMNALTHLNADQINAIGSNAKMLFTHDMDITSRTNIVRALEWSSVAQINAIGIYVGKLFKLDMDRSNQISIIRAFAGVEACEMPSRVLAILKITESLFKDMNGYAQTKIIEHLAPLNAEQIQEVALHFKDDMYLDQILELIQRVASQAAVPSGGAGAPAGAGAGAGTVGE